MKIKLFFILLLLPFIASAQVKDAYSLFDGKGRKVSYEKMIKDASGVDVLFFGELHNNTLNHWLELQIAKDVKKAGRDLSIGMEMFETDDQLIIDEYMNGLIDEKQFLNEAKFWDNYKTDYKPIVEFARSNKSKLVATNVPRRYANLAYKKGLAGLDSLSAEAKALIAPLPITVDYAQSTYKEMAEGMGSHGGGSAKNLVAAQALKDATMAHNILKHLQDGQVFYHLNGAFHSERHEGIITYLKQQKPSLKIITIHVVEQENLDTLEAASIGKADYILVIASDMTKSY